MALRCLRKHMHGYPSLKFGHFWTQKKKPNNNFLNQLKYETNCMHVTAHCIYGTKIPNTSLIFQATIEGLQSHKLQMKDLSSVQWPELIGTPPWPTPPPPLAAAFFLLGYSNMRTAIYISLTLCSLSLAHTYILEVWIFTGIKIRLWFTCQRFECTAVLNASQCIASLFIHKMSPDVHFQNTGCVFFFVFFYLPTYKNKASMTFTHNSMQESDVASER